MSLSILQSIHPKYCELIASGKKTIEVRKTKPRIQPPFKVYIYETKTGYVSRSYENDILVPVKYGKVIGEYVCDEITEYTTEFSPDDNLFQGIYETIYHEDDGDEYDEIVTGNDFDDPNNCDICKSSCLSFDDIKSYVGYGDGKFYGYHISNLKIYDKPKELSKFKKPCIYGNFPHPAIFAIGEKRGLLKYHLMLADMTDRLISMFAPMF